MAYYAVRKGRCPGVYDTWDACKGNVQGYKGAEFKKFTDKASAEEYLNYISSESSIKKEMGINSGLKDGEVIAYVDGSFDDKSNTYSYGVVLIDNKTEREFSGRDRHPNIVEMRNVAGELLGSVIAVNSAISLGYKKIYLHYDFQGIEKWVSKEWKANTPGTKEYASYMDEVKKRIEIEFIKVKAHSGVKYNEIVDKLAYNAPMI